MKNLPVDAFLHPAGFGLFAAWCIATLYCVAICQRHRNIPAEVRPWCNLLVLINGPWALTILLLRYRYPAGQRAAMEYREQIKGGPITRRLRQALGLREVVPEEAVLELCEASGKALSQAHFVQRGQTGAGVTQTKILLHDAIEARAPQLFLEPLREGQYAVQFELDGLKQELQRLPLDLGQRVVTCLKTAARLNLAERRQQDGHFLVQMPGADLQCRLTTLGTLQGPRATVIIKDPRVGPRPATALGLRSSDLETLLHLLDHRGKLILVSGPSGSGKTTTLYALLSRFNPERTRLATIEEHIEHPLPHIVQTEIGPTFQMDYSTALRSLVHREPEVIMVGDVSDSQTAELALQAAEGGRLILTGVEAKDSASAVMRLRGLGVTTRRMVDTVSAIVSQRLVRVLCTQCKEPIELGDELWAWARKHGLSSRRAHRPRGCPQCRNTGFRGRTGVFELLVITPQLSACLQREPSILELRQAMAAAGSRPLLSHAMEMISAGITSCEEVQRTCVQEAET